VIAGHMNRAGIDCPSIAKVEMIAPAIAPLE
jgi:hypothetical protein